MRMFPVLRSTVARHALLSAFVALVLPINGNAADTKTGEQIYRKMCASCHGLKGEGTDEHYPRELTGNRSVAQLAQQIAKTMPDNAVGTCVGEDAQKVAAYVYDAF